MKRYPPKRRKPTAWLRRREGQAGRSPVQDGLVVLIDAVDGAVHCGPGGCSCADQAEGEGHIKTFASHEFTKIAFGLFAHSDDLHFRPAGRGGRSKFCF